MLKQSATRLSLTACAAILAQALCLSSAYAVPSDRVAWNSLEHGITVYKDAVEDEVYWFIPKIRFEAKDGKTVLRPKTLLTGDVEYTARIIPYFAKDLRELVAQNIPNIRQASQLRPVVAKSIGIDIPDFGYKFKSADVTNYQYLDVPRLVKFTLTAEEAASFDELYQDDSGINVDFTLAYDGMMTDKFYNIDISCKQMARELETNFKPSVGVTVPVKGVKAFLGADLEFAFLNSVQNSLNGVNITSKGDVPGMQEMLRRVMRVCFEPVDNYDPYGTYDDERRDDRNDDRNDDQYPSRRTKNDTKDDTKVDPDGRRMPKRGDVINDNDGFIPRRSNAVAGGMTNRSEMKVSLASAEAKLLKQIHDKLVVDQEPEQDEPGNGLLPEVELKAKFKLKKTSSNTNSQTVVKNVAMKDSISTTVIAGILSAKPKVVEKVTVQAIAEKKVSVSTKHTAAKALATGIFVREGEQYTINAEYTFRASSGYSSWGGAKQYSWDASWEKTDKDLYFRVGNGHWTPVNRRAIIESDVTGNGGEIQFYMDRASIFNKIDEKLRKGTFFSAPVFTVGTIAPVYTIQISGRRIQVR